MIRGTVAQFQFKLPYNKEDVSIAEVKFWQNNNDGINEYFPLPIIKGYLRTVTENGEVYTSYPWNWVDDYTLSVTLGQQETLTFSDKIQAYVQIRAKTTGGITFASEQTLIRVHPLASDIPLGDEILPTPNDDGWIILDGQDIVE